MIVRTRSSRFFVILLHLVGVSTHLPSSPLDVFYPDDHEAETSLVAWLQDARDGTCFDPSGHFSDCGDATLWFIHKRKPSKIKMGVLQVDEEPEWQGYALQLLSQEQSMNKGFQRLWRRRRKDCLVPLRKPSLLQTNNNTRLELNYCRASHRAWSWQVTGQGVLQHTRDNKQRCLRRDGMQAFLGDCNAEPATSRLVQFSLVRYETQPPPSQDSNNDKEESDDKTAESNEHIRMPVDIAHDHANSALPHSASRLKRTSSQLTLTPPSRTSAPQSMGLLQGTNPMLWMGTSSKTEEDSPKSLSSSGSPFGLLQDANPILLLGRTHRSADEVLAAQPPPANTLNAPPMKLSPKKIRVHPYIEAANNEVWVDPQTGLEYRTDLCRYLGHDRKESGRHTLTGVGQYMRTVFNIKVYGVAFYVSKRDVLADPMFERFAHLTSEELRQRPDFYAHLRQMPSLSDPNAGLFDRTIMLKTNMQLSTETMRSSLEADWNLLSDEAIHMLMSSSLEPRPAEQGMLDLIQSPDNPSRCSCAQVAPPEYEADPACCARGTELVFTWRKNGDLEIRLDGRVMVTFPRPDIAAGIFYEYFRDDIPMSVDFKERVVDGFPFLLAPLVQVKGVSSPAISNLSASSKGNEDHANVLTRAVTGVSDMAMGLAGAVHGGAVSFAEHAADAARSMGDAARHAGEELDRRREVVWKNAVGFPEHALNTMRHPVGVVSNWMSEVRKGRGQKVEKELEPKARVSKAPRGRVFRDPVSKWLGEFESPEEKIPLVNTCTPRRVFMGFVHVYLLLLLIVSFPGTYTTRTKLVTRRPSKQVTSDTESETSVEARYRETERCSTPTRGPEQGEDLGERTWPHSPLSGSERESLLVLGNPGAVTRIRFKDSTSERRRSRLFDCSRFARKRHGVEQEETASTNSAPEDGSRKNGVKIKKSLSYFL